MSIRTVIRVRDEQLQSWLAKDPERSENAIRFFQTEGSPIVMTEMRRQAPLGKTGFLRESVDSRMTPKGFTVWPRADYAEAVDKGTRPHEIVPRVAKALRWFGPYGNPIFAMRVKHPGFKGRFFIRRTRELVRTPLRELLKDIWRRLLG